MAKKKPYMILNTKEDFDKVFYSGYNCGYESGFESGRISAIIAFDKMMDSTFSAEERSDAAYEHRRSAIAQWQKDRAKEVKVIEEERKTIISKVAKDTFV